MKCVFISFCNEQNLLMFFCSQEWRWKYLQVSVHFIDLTVPLSKEHGWGEGLVESVSFNIRSQESSFKIGVHRVGVMFLC